MAEVSVENNVVGEDWDSECNDSTQNISAPVLSDVSGTSACEVLRDDALLSDVSCSSAADVAAEADKGTYVSDSKKVFVSNINYRVGQFFAVWSLRVVLVGAARGACLFTGYNVNCWSNACKLARSMTSSFSVLIAKTLLTVKMLH